MAQRFNYYIRRKDSYGNWVYFKGFVNSKLFIACEFTYKKSEAKVYRVKSDATHDSRYIRSGVDIEKERRLKI